MDSKRRSLILATLVLFAINAVGEERLAVLEFFGRPTGAYCSAAGPGMTQLQSDYAGEAVLLEYDFDLFRSGRIDRFLATGVPAPYLPLVMVGSGFQTSSGWVNNHVSTYGAMIEAELARRPEASVHAYWRRSGARAKVWTTVRNLSGRTLTTNQETAIWVVVWENAAIGVSQTWVRGTEKWALVHDLADQASVSRTFEVEVDSPQSWNNISCLALFENRNTLLTRYDMLQAAVAKPAGLYVSQNLVVMNHVKGTAEIALEGPSVLSISATSSTPWLELSSTSSRLPATLHVTLIPELRPPSANTATIDIDAEGDGMSFSNRVNVEIRNPVRTVQGRVRADP